MSVAYTLHRHMKYFSIPIICILILMQVATVNSYPLNLYATPVGITPGIEEFSWPDNVQGVGKTNVVANPALALTQLGKKILVLDADMGLGNLDIMLGLTPTYNLHHVIKGDIDISDVIVRGPGGMMILPASSGVQELSELTPQQKLNLLSELDKLDHSLSQLTI